MQATNHLNTMVKNGTHWDENMALKLNLEPWSFVRSWVCHNQYRLYNNDALRSPKRNPSLVMSIFPQIAILWHLVDLALLLYPLPKTESTSHKSGLKPSIGTVKQFFIMFVLPEYFYVMLNRVKAQQTQIQLLVEQMAPSTSLLY